MSCMPDASGEMRSAFLQNVKGGGKQMNRTKRWMGMLLAVLSLTLTGCDYIQPNPENLLRPPEMTDEQTEIYEALESGIGEVRFKYPQTGNNRNGFAAVASQGKQKCIQFFVVCDDVPNDILFSLLCLV